MIEASIVSVLKQNYQNFELLIIDDASTNWVLATIQELISSDPRIRIIRNSKNLHLVQTLNIWISQAEWKYIARIDHDDIWPDSSKLQKQVDFMENNSEYWLFWEILNLLIHLYLFENVYLILYDFMIQNGIMLKIMSYGYV